MLKRLYRSDVLRVVLVFLMLRALISIPESIKLIPVGIANQRYLPLAAYEIITLATIIGGILSAISLVREFRQYC